MHHFLNVLRKYFVFSGRASRSEFWCFAFFYGITLTLAVLIDMISGTFDWDVGLGWASGFFVLATLAPALGVQVRRLHDVGRNGWWAMLNIIPVVGPFALLVINVFGGHPGPNAYGPDQETATACTSGRRSNRETRRARRPLKLVATLIGVVMLVAGGVQYLWSTHGKEIVAAGQASFEEGRRAGMALHESDCLAEALARHGNGSSSSLGASVSNSVRLSGCLRASSADIAFCLAVPPSIEILAVARWLNTSCARQQFSDPLCQNLFQAVVRYCESPERADKLKRGGMPRKIDA